MRRFRFATAIVACLLVTTACTSSSSRGGSPGSEALATTTTNSSSAERTTVDSKPSTAPSSPEAPSAQSAAIAGIAGAWMGSFQSTKSPSTQGALSVTFAQNGTALTGTIAVASGCVAQGTITGLVDGARVTFGAIQAAETITFDGILDADSMSGRYQSGPGCGDDNGTWIATRE